ncbi:MAG TPA: hypothetical protein VGO86_18190 [Candidatus Dormibacteraeota bacterium]|jgi:hypothetical protein
MSGWNLGPGRYIPGVIEFQLDLRANFCVTMSIPDNITEREANHLRQELESFIDRTRERQEPS